MEWRGALDDMPGWQDLGRHVEAETESGTRIVGAVTYEDMTPGPDEWPILQIYAVVNDFPVIVEWSSVARWRYLPIES